MPPYTEGSRLLLLQIRDNGDSSLYFVYSFVLIHILLKENRKEAINLCWDKEKFRERLFDWISTLSESDLSTASSIVSQMIDEAAKAKVEVVEGGSSGGNG